VPSGSEFEVSGPVSWEVGRESSGEVVEIAVWLLLEDRVEVESVVEVSELEAEVVVSCAAES